MESPIRLRPLTERDLPLLRRWRQTPALWGHPVGAFQPRAEAEAIVLMRKWVTPTRTELRLAIEAADDGSLLGLVALAPIDAEEGVAELHIFLGEAETGGRSYARAATAAALVHAFDELALWRVGLRVLQTDLAALQVYAALGFTPDAGARPSVVEQGVEVEVLTLSVTDAVFRQRLAG